MSSTCLAVNKELENVNERFCTTSARDSICISDMPIEYVFWILYGICLSDVHIGDVFRISISDMHIALEVFCQKVNKRGIYRLTWAEAGNGAMIETGTQWLYLLHMSQTSPECYTFFAAVQPLTATEEASIDKKISAPGSSLHWSCVMRAYPCNECRKRTFHQTSSHIPHTLPASAGSPSRLQSYNSGLLARYNIPRSCQQPNTIYVFEC